MSNTSVNDPNLTQCEMNQAQIHLIQDSFARLAPDADLVADLFYARLFQLEPSLRNRLPHDLSAHKGHLVYALSRAVRDLQVRQAQRCQCPDVEVIGAALLWTLELGLGEQYTTDVRDAWTALYPQIAARLPLLRPL
jgi:hemoglobin-like flavoprotein